MIILPPILQFAAAPSPGRFSSAVESQVLLPDALLGTPVLIVEDEMMIAWQLQDHLTDLGFGDVRTAASYAAAIAAADTAEPGLLISDVNLGEGPDGIATAQELHTRYGTPAIFITGYVGSEIAERIDAALPGSALLRKPVETGPLIRALLASVSPVRH